MADEQNRARQISEWRLQGRGACARWAAPHAVWPPCRTRGSLVAARSTLLTTTVRWQWRAGTEPLPGQPRCGCHAERGPGGGQRSPDMWSVQHGRQLGHAVHPWGKANRGLRALVFLTTSPQGHFVGSDWQQNSLVVCDGLGQVVGEYQDPVCMASAGLRVRG